MAAQNKFVYISWIVTMPNHAAALCLCLLLFVVDMLRNLNEVFASHTLSN